jgi:hypothetical protein
LAAATSTAAAFGRLRRAGKRFDRGAHKFDLADA